MALQQEKNQHHNAKVGLKLNSTLLTRLCLSVFSFRKLLQFGHRETSLFMDLREYGVKINQWMLPPLPPFFQYTTPILHQYSSLLLSNVPFFHCYFIFESYLKFIFIKSWNIQIRKCWIAIFLFFVRSVQYNLTSNGHCCWTEFLILCPMWDELE